jgi:beta-ureidopropionase
MRQVWIASISSCWARSSSSNVNRPFADIDEVVATAFERMEAVAAYAPDLVCLPEDFKVTNLPAKVPTARALEICPEDGLLERFAAWARGHKCYVILPMIVRRDGKLLNSAVVIDRGGTVVGRYDKIYPTEYEIDDYAISPPPTTEVPVFDLDFGRIGIQICFDIGWPGPWNSLGDKGAEVVFWPSAYAGGRPLEGYAWTNGYYVVSSTRSNSVKVYDVTGDVIGASGAWRPWVCMPINLDKRVFHADFHFDKTRAIEKKYGRRVKLDWVHDENWFTIESLDPGVTVDGLVAEFGLLSLKAYTERATRHIEAHRK